MFNITLKDKDILVYEAIEKYILSHGYSPSYQEIADKTGMAKSSIHNHIKKLQIMGFIETDSSTRRTLRLPTIQTQKTREIPEFRMQYG